ncbi:MAG: hypothetical protein H6839_13235 [Planctomycetes bacterium]|nr:hypothetical protein [Planctomycetota bacterium]
MKPVLSILLVLLAAPVFAHPLDDRAQMASEVVIDSDYRLEYVIDFRYVSVLASYSEFSGGGMSRGLDADEDGFVSHAELKRRYNDLVDQLLMAFGIEVDGRMISLEPDFNAFLFENMDAPGEIDLTEPVPIDSFRIHYRFVFYWNAPRPLEPGGHEVTYFFNQQQSVIHTPSEQMIAFDARSTPRVRLTDVKYDDAMGAIPRLVFNWHVELPKVPVELGPPPPEGWRPPDQAVKEPGIDWQTGPPEPETVAQLVPAWLTLLAGAALAVYGLVSLIFMLVKGPPEGSVRSRVLFNRGLVILAGAVVAFGAMVRLEIIHPM